MHAKVDCTGTSHTAHPRAVVRLREMKLLRSDHHSTLGVQLRECYAMLTIMHRRTCRALHWRLQACRCRTVYISHVLLLHAIGACSPLSECMHCYIHFRLTISVAGTVLCTSRLVFQCVLMQAIATATATAAASVCKCSWHHSAHSVKVVTGVAYSCAACDKQASAATAQIAHNDCIDVSQSPR